MKKILNIGYWFFTIALCLCGVFFLALTYIPAGYVEPVLAKMHISYEWCIGLSTTSFATVCIFIVTKLGYNLIVQKLSSQALQASEQVKESNERMQSIENLFSKSIACQNEIINRLKQLEVNNSAILEMEKQTAKDRLSGAMMSNTNRVALEKALQNVVNAEQQIAELKATEVVYEQTVEKVVEVENTQPGANDGLI